MGASHMRAFNLAILPLALVVPFAACSTASPGDAVGSNAADLSDADLAKAALGILGADNVPPAAGDTKSCGFTGCHSINTVTVTSWSQEFRAAMDMLQSSAPVADKLNYVRADSHDPTSPFVPERLGFMAAGAHLMPGADVSATVNPNTFKQAQLIASLFAGQDDLYTQFRAAVKMPVLDSYPKLTAAKYETILTWFQKGMPQLHELLPEDRPTACVDNFDALRTRTSAVKTQNWQATNRARQLPMVGCAPPDGTQSVSATSCFQQQIAGKDVFPNAAQTDVGRTWAEDGSTVRILRQLSGRNSYWLRSSADGRFSMTGGGAAGGGAQAVDHLATLSGHNRDIGLNASYDPDFWPDNRAFMFQGGTKFCAQSLLEKATTTLVSFSEPECSNLSSASGLYQTVGEVIDDNAMSDRFIVFSDWAGDAGSFSASAVDTTPRGGPDSAVNVYTAIAVGTDVSQGYKVNGPAFKIDTPYRGDTMMSRSGHLLGNRWSYGQAADGTTAHGYAIEKLDYQLVGGHYQFNLSSLGNICLRGNKANFSYDERFFTTHHYNEPSDYTASDDPAYHQKGSSDIYIVDFITGKKQKVTKMGPGQFALYPHFRSDGWLYFLAVDYNQSKYYVAAIDWAIRQAEATPTP
jgi:hypothetical protein